MPAALRLFEIVENVEPFPALLLGGVIYFVGSKAVGEREKLRSCAWCFAGLVVVAYVLLALAYDQVDEPGLFFMHALGAGLFVAGASCIVLTVLVAVWEALRTLFRSVFGTLFRGVGNAVSSWSQSRQHKRAARQERKELPERERIRREEDQKEASEQVRREESRCQCLLAYRLLAPRLGERFSQQMFDDYVARYLGDSLDPPFVEARARQLIDLLEKLAEQLVPVPARRELSDLSSDYEKQRKHIEDSGLDDDMKQSLLAHLRAVYYERLQRHLEES